MKQKELELREKELKLKEMESRLKAQEASKGNSGSKEVSKEPVKRKLLPNERIINGKIVKLKASKPATVNNKKVVKAVETKKSSIDKTMYSEMSSEVLMKYVKRFMLGNGIEKHGISSELLCDEFGTDNIQRLLIKSYLIKLPDKTLTYNF